MTIATAIREVLSEPDYWEREYRAWAEIAKGRPERLTPIAPDHWPPCFYREVQLQCWHSRAYLAQWYAEQPFNGIPCTRLSICRFPVVKEGRWTGGYLWNDPFSWEEIMAVKAALGFGDVY